MGRIWPVPRLLLLWICGKWPQTHTATTSRKPTVYDVKTSILTPQQVIGDVGDIDLLLASPECTSHSPAKGNRSPCEESRATAFEVTRFAKVMKPRWIVVENVIQMQHWNRFEEWRESLEALGYKIKVRDFDAQYHNVPQSRRRLFIIGDLEREPSLPKRKQRTRKTVKSSILGKGESPTNPWRFSPVNIPTRARATIERVQRRAIETLGDDVPFIMVYYGNDGAGGFQDIGSSFTHGYHSRQIRVRPAQRQRTRDADASTDQRTCCSDGVSWRSPVSSDKPS